MKSIYEKLEFAKIKDKIATYAHCELAHIYIANLKMFAFEELQDELLELKEAFKYAANYKGISVYHIKNIMKDLALLYKEGAASIEFFATISLMLENVSEIKKEYTQDENYPLLNDNISNLKNLESLKNRIDSVISKDLSIYDNASSHLASIRFQIKKEEDSQGKILSSLMNKYRNYLNDERMAFRSQGLALPIKTTYKNRVEGVVIDVSSSGNTSFIMPLEILLSNNKIELLKEQEQQEILRILKDLAHITSQHIEDLRKDLLILAHLDYLFAKVAYAFDIKAIVADIGEELRLIDARHPLIDANKIVSNSFIFENKKIMLITGPNAGGKTVALKTIALLILMHQCGLAIPCVEASIPYFENIFLDIGDDQSLSDNLSTFTSHMQALKNAVLNINKQSLVIIDELGSGTSPLDGEALAIGVLKHLHKFKAYAVVSSHYDGLKSFALENEYILSASMVFDEENLLPTYRIRLGSVGKSYGIEVATREGLPLDIIQYAKEYILEKKSSTQEQMVETLNQKLLEVDNLKVELELKKQESEQIILKQNKELEKIKLEKEKLDENFQEEKEKLLLKAKLEVEEMMDEFKVKKDVKMHEVISLKKKIDDSLKSDGFEEEYFEEEKFNEGDRVIYKPSELKGFVKKITKDQATVSLDTGLVIKVKINTLGHVKENNKVKKVKKDQMFIARNDFNNNVSLECNVIGLYVKEALDVVSKYLDDARKVKYHRVRIVHGNGTGKLRQAIHEYLRKQSFVESFNFAVAPEGGTGATVVNLK